MSDTSPIQALRHLGLLLRAKSIRRIDMVGPLIESLESGISFRVPLALRAYALRLAGET